MRWRKVQGDLAGNFESSFQKNLRIFALTVGLELQDWWWWCGRISDEALGRWGDRTAGPVWCRTVRQEVHFLYLISQYNLPIGTTDMGGFRSVNLTLTSAEVGGRYDQ
jgi:hypothetical protein